MYQSYLCACCGEENEVFIDPSSGDSVQLVEDCAVCCRPNVIRATFNPTTGEYDLDIYQEDRG